MIEIRWTLNKINMIGEEIEVEYDVECDVTPYDPGRISGPPEKCYPPEGGEVEITEITLCNDGQGRRVKLDPKNYEAAGFTAKVLEEIDEAAFQKAMEREEEYDEPEPPEPMDHDDREPVSEDY